MTPSALHPVLPSALQRTLTRFSLHNLLAAVFLLATLVAQPATAAPPSAPLSTEALSASLPGAEDSAFLPVDQAFRLAVSQEGAGLLLRWKMAAGYYLYAGRITVSTQPDGTPVGPLAFSRPGKLKHDDYFGEVEVYHDEIEVRVDPGSLAQDRDLELKITYQGCADAGLCYPPVSVITPYLAPVATESSLTAAPPPMVTPDGDPLQSSQKTKASLEGALSRLDTDSASSLNAFLEDAPLALTLLVFLALGAGLAFTPCVFPMIPILSSLIAGQEGLSVRRASLLSLAYVSGMAFTYAAIGVLVAHLGAGANLQAHLQEPWLLLLFSLLFVALALSMFGFFTLQLPAFLRDRLDRAQSRSRGGSLAGAALMGLLSALVVSPCVSAPLAGALLYISTTGDGLLGGAALLALGYGMGLPLLAIGSGGARLLPRAGAWMEGIKNFFGVALLAVALWLLERILPAALNLALWSLLLGVSAVYLGAFDVVESAWNGWRRLRKGLGLLLFTYAVILLFGAAAGATDPLRPLASLAASARDVTPQPVERFRTVTSLAELHTLLEGARQEQQPVMIDFYADWCISCKVMERTVLADVAVQRALARHLLIRADVTAANTDSSALLAAWNVFGPPAFVFLDANGNELRQHRVIGETGAEAFLAQLPPT